MISASYGRHCRAAAPSLRVQQLQNIEPPYYTHFDLSVGYERATIRQ
jgi:hypothetical protein